MSDASDRKMQMDEALQLQKAILRVLPTDPVSDKTNAAARLLLEQRYDECIQAYEAIAVQHPEERGLCMGQIGAAHYFKGEYRQAILCYEEAKAAGEDVGMMDENIAEAEEAIAKEARGEDPLAQPAGLKVFGKAGIALFLLGGLAVVLIAYAVFG